MKAKKENAVLISPRLNIAVRAIGNEKIYRLHCRILTFLMLNALC
jgi:hypothetical protein